jgi:hypothetical protein
VGTLLGWRGVASNRRFAYRWLAAYTAQKSLHVTDVK